MSKSPKTQQSADPAAGAIGTSAVGGSTEGASNTAADFPLAQAVAAVERMQAAVQELAVQAAKSAEAAEYAARNAADSAKAADAILMGVEMHAKAAETAADAALDQAAPTLAAMTLAEAAGLVRRRKVVQADGAEPRVFESPISPDEVLAFKDHGTHVVVVTTDGQKHSSARKA